MPQRMANSGEGDDLLHASFVGREESALDDHHGLLGFSGVRDSDEATCLNLQHKAHTQ